MSADSGTREPATLAGDTAVACASYAPGHQMHYTHQGQALRSPSRRVHRLMVDGDRVYLLLDDGDEIVWHHHDRARLIEVLGLFPTFQVAYPRFHALRVGPYWFNCAEAGLAPCPQTGADAP